MAQGTGLASADQGKEPAFAAPGTGPVSAVRAFVALASVAQAQALVLGPVSVAQASAVLVLVPASPVQELVQVPELAFPAPGTGLQPAPPARVLVPASPVQELVQVRELAFPARVQVQVRELAFPARVQVPVRELAFPARELAQVPGQASQAPGTVGTVGTDPQPAVPVPRTDLQSGSGS